MPRAIASHVFIGLTLVLIAACTNESVAPTLHPSVPLFSATDAFNNAGACLGDDALTWHELVQEMESTSDPAAIACGANDLILETITPTQVMIDGAWVDFAEGESYCIENEPVTFTSDAGLVMVANAVRHDIGMWLATDGGGARVGACNHYNIPTNPLPTGASNVDGDQCGDMEALHDAVIALGEITVPCTAGTDGFLEVGSCIAWSTPAHERVCPVAAIASPDGFRAGTLPDIVFSCRCAAISVPITPIPAPTAGTLLIRMGSFSLLKEQTTDALSGSFSIRNNSSSQDVAVTGLAITSAWLKQANNQIPVALTGCTFTPSDADIAAGSTQTFTLSECDVSPAIDNKKDLYFVVRADASGAQQPFYERSFKVKAH